MPSLLQLMNPPTINRQKRSTPTSENPCAKSSQPSEQDLATRYGGMLQNLALLGRPGETPGNISHDEYRRKYKPPSRDSCPGLDANSVNVNDRSLCPTQTYLSESDPDRFPRVMAYAYCLCEDCRHHHRNLCEIVWSKTLVLRHDGKTCVNGVKVYEPEYEAMPVGCTCALPRQQPLG